MVEICCGCVEDCVKAELGGADRIELNSALKLGGLTPSVATLRLVKQKVSLPIITMVRPRGSGFYYSDVEKEVMFMDAKILLEEGADGLAFGFLNEDNTIDVENTKKMCELIHSYHKEAVFHRAFDLTLDPVEAMSKLIECSVDRVLTSGLEEVAPKGIEVLKQLSERFSNQIEILAGSGVNETNALKIMQEAKLSQVHSSCKVVVDDPNSVRKDGEQAEKYEVSDLEKIKKLVQSIK